MKISNQHNLPQALVNAITANQHSNKGFSVTQLIDPPQKVQLTRRHWDEIEEDVSDRLWALLGSAVHYILEKGAPEDSLAEERLTATVNGVEISGQSDLWDNGVIDDYKVTSVYSVLYNPNGKPEWHAQMNVYRSLFLVNGFASHELNIYALLRDWQKGKSHAHDYPPIPFVRIPIPLWDGPVVADFITQRLNVHLKAETLDDIMLPECTPLEMWEKPTTWAVMKPGRKSALRVLDTEAAAGEYMKQQPANCYIQQRPGGRTRCDDYCSAAPFCQQYKKYKEEHDASIIDSDRVEDSE